MSILQYASPTGEYSSYDRDIFEDYDNRIGTYNKALTEYKALAEPYQGLVDTHNTAIGTYNTQLDKYKVDAAAYNKAIEEFNAGPRTTEYAGPASPGEFSGIMPIFQGGEAPVAPEDPGFSGADVDEFVEAAGDRARAVANSQATAQAVMTDPTQTYRTAAGDVNLGGMAGFSSTAMGMRDGGIVQNFQEGGLAMDSPYADPMQQNRALPPPQPSIQAFSSNNQGGIGGMFEGLQQATPVPQVQAPLQGGIGGQFEQMNQLRNQMGGQMANMQGAPLETYKSYLQQVYNQPEMEKATQALGGALNGRVEEFVNMVDEAERAHFGAEESFGFGGGEFQKGLMSQYEDPMQKMQQSQMDQQGSQGQLGNIGGQMGQMAMMFEDGGMVAARPPVSGPTPDVYMKEGGQTAFAPASDEALTKTRQKVIKDYGFDPLQIAMEEGVDPELYLRVMHQESKGDASAVSSAGARNLMQIMPATAADLGIKDLDDPLANARGGARYLLQQLNEFGTVPLALAAYNAGPGNVRKYKGVPPFDETRKYVSIIHGVSAGEILPNTEDFFQMNPDDDPVRKPMNRPEGLGTADFEPTQRIMSEYLMMNEPQEPPMPEAPTMRPKGRPMAPEDPRQEGGEDAFYKQYAAYDYESGPR